MGSDEAGLGAGRPRVEGPVTGRSSGGRLRAAAARWPLALLLWLTPSIGQLIKFAGRPGSVLVIGAAAIGIAAVLVWTMTPSAQRRWSGPSWNLLIAVALCVVFAVAYPVAVSGLFGRGSDRADALDVTGVAMLAGRLIYQPLTYLGNPPTPMPGAVFLALPFHLIGGAALQNIFWFPLFCALAPRIVGDRRGGAAYLALFVLGCPGVLLDFATGGDFATNAIYVIIATWLMTRLRPDETWPVRFLACLFFACALSSRPIYIVEAPIVAGVLLRRDGRRTMVETMACVAVLLAVIDGPVWVADPAHFPAMMHAGMLNIYAAWVHAGVVIPAISIAIACSALFVDLARGRIWLLSAISLAPVVAPTFLFAVYRRGLDPLLIVLDSYTLPLTLFAGLWLLRPPTSRPADAPIQAPIPSAS
jgi:hypothetical protein